MKLLNEQSDRPASDGFLSPEHLNSVAGFWEKKKHYKNKTNIAWSSAQFLKTTKTKPQFEIVQFICSIAFMALILTTFNRLYR